MATLTLPPELLQRHIEDFFAAHTEILAGRVGLVGAQMNGIACRAAARCGWLDVVEDGVGEMKPAEVLRYATAINKAIAAAYDLPGE